MGQDGTGGKQDEKSSATPAPPSEKTAKTYTEAEVEQIRKEMQGHKDRGIAEQEKWTKAGILQVKAHESTIAKLQAERDDLLTKADGGADLVAINKKLKEERSALEKERAEFNMDKLAHEEEKAKVNEFKRQQKIEAIATEFKVNVESLRKLNPQSEEQMKEFAQIIAGSAPPPAPPPAGVGTGSGKKTKEDILREMYPTLSK
jgi:LysM repeat protein